MISSFLDGLAEDLGSLADIPLLGIPVAMLISWLGFIADIFGSIGLK